jgi:4'-phosphopantetheinyl transferase EntD
MPSDGPLRLDLPEGVCVGVPIPADPPPGWDSELLPAERAFAAALAPARRLTWVAGRIALRAALAGVGLDVGPILPDDHGAPALPPEARGSVSHKRRLAVAIAARTDDVAGACLGIDLEEEVPPRFDLARRVLTPEERRRLPEEDPARWRALLVHFSLKEALYKAVHPFVRRHVSFQEVSIGDPRADGETLVTLALRGGEGPFEARGRVLRAGDHIQHILTTARVGRI